MRVYEHVFNGLTNEIDGSVIEKVLKVGHSLYLQFLKG
jgi:hypothetical protein